MKYITVRNFTLLRRDTRRVFLVYATPHKWGKKDTMSVGATIQRTKSREKETLTRQKGPKGCRMWEKRNIKEENAWEKRSIRVMNKLTGAYFSLLSFLLLPWDAKGHKSNFHVPILSLKFLIWLVFLGRTTNSLTGQSQTQSQYENVGK